MLVSWDDRLRRHRGVVGVLIFFLAFVIFSSSLANRFVFDDLLQIVQNPFVTNRHLWAKNFTTSSFGFTGASTNFYRPLQFFSYWLISGAAGLNPGAFHLYQLLLYGVAAIVVYRIGRELFASDLTALLGALLWVAHPLHVEAVAYIPGLPYAGSGLFYLLSFWLFLCAERAQERRLPRHVLAALAYFPGLFFNEMAFTLPLLLLAYWFFLGGPESWMKRLARWAPYAMALAVGLAIRVAVLGHFSQAKDLWKITPRVAGSALGLLGEHTRLFFWPLRLNGFHTFDLDASLHSPWPWLTLLGVLAAIGLRRRGPLFAFLVAWWPVALLPCLDARQLSFPLLAERFDYLPSVGLCLALAFVGGVWLPRQAPRAEKMLTPALALVALLWIVQVQRLIPNYFDNEAMWNYSATVAPDAALVHLYQAELCFIHSDLEGAAHEYRTALRLNEASFRPLLGVYFDSYTGLGRIAEWQNHIKDAIAYYQKAVDLAPGHAQGYRQLGALYFPRGDYVKSAKYFAQAVQLNPQDTEARFFLGTCLLKLGKYGDAARQFHAAREVDPTYWQAFAAEARALDAMGDPAGAGQARRLMPKHMLGEP